MQLELVTSREAFDELEQEWTDLYERAGRPGNPFQSFAWCWHWANNFLNPRKADELFILTGRTDGKLTMVWPMVRERAAGMNSITWLGAPVTQYGDVLIDGEKPLNMLREAWRYLHANANADIISLYKVREDSAIAPLMCEIGSVMTHKDKAPYADLSQSETFEDYAQGRYTSKRRKYLRRYARRFEELAPLKTDVLDPGNEARQTTEELIALKQDWLRSKSMVSRALSDPRTTKFFLDTATDVKRHTGCRVTALRFGDELIGANLAYLAKGRLIVHVIAYNLEHEKWSPGNLTTYEDIKHCKEDGIQSFDFMGPFADFKLDWSDDTVEVNDWAIPLSIKGKLWTHLYLGYGRDKLKALHRAMPRSIKKVTAQMATAIFVVA